VVRHTSRLTALLNVLPVKDDDRTDDRLLRDFLTYRDQDAFAALVRRHQRTVWGVCRRTLPNPDDAEDAFQATFLILTRSGRNLSDPERTKNGSLGGWLYRVAHRVARKAQVRRAKRLARETRVARAESRFDAEPHDPGLATVIGEELNRLPERHRLAVILCDLDGLSRFEAAVRLGWNEGTLSTRLHRGRKELAGRLTRRGITMASAGFAIAGLHSVVPAKLTAATIELSAAITLHGWKSTTLSAGVAELLTTYVREMTMRVTTKILAGALLVAGFAGTGWLGLRTPLEPVSNAVAAPALKPEAKPEVPATAIDLLRHRKVLKELKCTPEQRVAIEDHYDEQAEKAPAPVALQIEVAPGQPIDPAAIQKKHDEQMKARRDAMTEETRKVVDKILKDEQFKRLKQIELQVRGAAAFQDEKIAEELKLTDAQKKVVAEAMEEFKPQGRVIRPGIAMAPAAPGIAIAPAPALPALPAIAAGGGNVVIGGFVGGRNVTVVSGDNPFSAARKKAYDKVVAELKDDQKKVWDKLIGEATKFDPHTLTSNGGFSTLNIGGVFNRVVPAPAIAPAKEE
jgi:RNA polymerase sigma factor (sigma-70 family)